VSTVLLAWHTGQVSGAELTVLELLERLGDEVRPVVACPPGALAKRVQGLGVAQVDVLGTSGSLRLHPVRTPRALAELSAFGVALRRIAARVGADLVHAVSLRAGIAAALARRLGGPPFVLDQHDSLAPGPMASALRAVVDPPAAAIASNSRHTAASLHRAGFRSPMEVIPPGVDLARFAEQRGNRANVRTALGVPDEAPC